jgi:hypothetical protein
MILQAITNVPAVNLSLPPSAVASEATRPSGTANANDQPMKLMSKEEESTSMP